MQLEGGECSVSVILSEEKKEEEFWVGGELGSE